MKYRVLLDLSFAQEADAQALMTYAKTLTSKAVSLNEGNINEEIAYCDIHKCHHDEVPTRPCEKIERVEVRKIIPITPVVSVVR